jgi:H+-transporting ATPase
MRNYSIHVCAVTIRIVVCFAILAFAYKFNFPPFMILVVAPLNDGTIVTLSVDRALPSLTPDSWDLAEIFAYAVAYGLYLTLSTIALVILILETTFFQDKFCVSPENRPNVPLANNGMLHMIIYLQVGIISQAPICVTRSHGFFFMERPSAALFIAFCIAQLVSSIIAAYGNWGFTNIHAISGGWIGIVWVWVCHPFTCDAYTLLTVLLEHHLAPPLDFVKFTMKATVIKYLRQRRERRTAADAALGVAGVPLVKTTSRAASVHESLYSNRVSFIRGAARKVGFGEKISVKPEKLQGLSSIQAAHTGVVLARHPSRLHA